jgi:hypothetical protein
VQLLDIIATSIGIRLGAVETNFLFADYRHLLLIKGVIIIAVSLYILYRARPGESLKIWMLSLFWMLVPVWNAGVIILLIYV